MNKRIAIPIISVLAVGAIVLGVFYFQETNKLNDARDEIAGLEGNVSALETLLAEWGAGVSTLEADLATAEGQALTLEADLATAEGQVLTLEADLATAEGQVLTLEIDLAAAGAEVSALEADLATAEGQVLTLEAELAASEAQVLTLEIELAAALGSTKVYIMPAPILGSAFFPAVITVPVGTTVTWTNISDFEHTATSYPPLFNSGPLSLGESFSYTFTQPGVFYYNCDEDDCPYHEERSGKVIVE